MSTDTFDDAPAIANSAKTGQIETDLFCHGCGYNLHGQVVTADDRLGFMICRCPECGRHHPAGFGTSAASVWLKRLGTILLFVWIAIVLGATVLSLIALGGFQAGYVNEFLWYNWVNAGQSYYSLSPPAGADLSQIPGWSQAIALYLCAGAFGFFLGTALVTLLWHWPSRRYFWAIALPLISAAFLLLLPFRDHEYDHVWTWCVTGVGVQCGIEIIGILLGTSLGRPLARAVVRTIVPPKPRQFLVFLWTVDGKAHPSAGSKSTSQLS
jgi:hypothetical protein